MKVLIALPNFPYPPNDGGLKAAFYMIDYLRNYFDITVICSYGDADSLAALQKVWPNVRVISATVDAGSVHTIRQDKTVKTALLHIAKRILKFLLRSIEKLSSHENPMDACNSIRKRNMYLYKRAFILEESVFVNRFQDLVNKEKFDIIQVEFSPLMGIVSCIPEQCKKIFVHHELTFKVIEREMQTLDHVVPYDVYLYKNARIHEMALLSRYDNIIVLSDQDSFFLEQNNIRQEKILVSPFAVPVQAMNGNNNIGFSFQQKIIFLGSDSHNPNLDAVYWFVKDVFPVILKKHPGITFYVIGSWKKEIVDLFKGLSQVVFTGYIDNLEEFILGAVMVIPIRIGSGIRTKILDAVMWKVPVLTTTIGVEGLPLDDGVHCLIADKPEEFVEKLSLVYDARFTSAMIQNAFKRLSFFSDVKRCGELRKDIYNMIIKNESAVLQ